MKSYTLRPDTVTHTELQFYSFRSLGVGRAVAAGNLRLNGARGSDAGDGVDEDERVVEPLPRRLHHHCRAERDDLRRRERAHDRGRGVPPAVEQHQVVDGAVEGMFIIT